MIFFLIASGTSISFNPFNIKLKTPIMGFGCIFLAIAISLIITQSKMDGAKEKEKEMLKMFDEVLDKNLRKAVNSPLPKD